MGKHSQSVLLNMLMYTNAFYMTNLTQACASKRRAGTEKHVILLFWQDVMSLQILHVQEHINTSISDVLIAQTDRKGTQYHKCV